MNPLDMGIICITGFCLIRGLFRGLIREVSSIIGVLAGFYAAYTYYPLLTEILRQWLTDGDIARMLAFLAIFLGVFVVVSLLGMLIRMLLNIVFLGWVDRVGGGGFGLLKGILIVSVVLLAMTTFLPKKMPLLAGSRLAPKVVAVSEGLVKVVPKDMKQRFRNKVDALKKDWKKGGSLF